ncbi:MAG: hypothetical protein KAJ63_09485 [Methyloprofundus sp.]|nr:hypothetical protein [Methyloprofundus sp.]
MALARALLYMITNVALQKLLPAHQLHGVKNPIQIEESSSAHGQLLVTILEVQLYNIFMTSLAQRLLHPSTKFLLILRVRPMISVTAPLPWVHLHLNRLLLGLALAQSQHPSK